MGILLCIVLLFIILLVALLYLRRRKQALREVKLTPSGRSDALRT
jgi:hypothetical protein